MNTRNGSKWVAMASLLTLLCVASSAVGDWHTFVIRNATIGGSSPTISDNTSYGIPAKEFIVTASGQKAGWGSSSLDGKKLSDIARLIIQRLDDVARFTAGSGPAVAPYVNIWITNGAGKYAVIGNEPSDAVWASPVGSRWNMDWNILKTKVAKVYENSDKTWLPNNGVGLTFADLADFVVQAPTVAELTTGWAGLGTGAPRELGTNKAYGFNWVFGDSLSNYVSGDPGYVVANPVANAFVTTGYLVSPSSLASSLSQFGPPHGTGTNPFAFDWDSVAPTTAVGAPEGYGASSFYASVVQGGAKPADRYRTLRIGMQSLFGHSVSVGQIAKISYYTNKPAPATAIDWRLSIYTTLNPAGGNAGSWYCNRIQSHPSGSLNLDAPANQWNLWSTAAGTNQMVFGTPGTSRMGFSTENIPLSELTAGPVTRNGNTWNFTGEEIMLIDLILGANSGGGTGASQVDGYRIELTTGATADIDLTAGCTWKVATVHGHEQFTIGQDASSLNYHMQPRNTRGWHWENNNGSGPGTLATGGLQTPNGYRDGSRTFACSDVAVGQTLNTVKLSFEYKTALGYTTINYFLTDGNGKFGIFAPTSLGIAGVSTIQVLDSEWSRITLDLTAEIPDSTNVAIYEHNGFSTEHVEPFTTLQWGDIKNLKIAGMFDYQRSPAHGWSTWGTMFGQINAAGTPAIVNGYGLALIWGDTVGNNAYATQSREIRNVAVSFGGIDYIANFADAQVRDVLKLDVPAESLYIRPGESIIVDMNVLHLLQKVNACQAMLGYSSSVFADPTGGTVQVAGSGPWDQVIWDSWKDTTGIAGEIDTAIGINADGVVGTDADSKVCKIALTAKAAIGDGTTKLIFRPNAVPDVGLVKSTFLSSISGESVWPTKFDSVNIIIDGTPPVITCPGDVTVYPGQPTDPPATGLATATDDNAPVIITYSDNRSGLTGCNGTGTIVRTWTATDPAGNTSTCTQNIILVDNVPPVLSACPGNITQNTDSGLCSAVVTYTPPTAMDEVYIEGFEDEQFQSGDYQTMPSVSWNDYNSRLIRAASGTDGIVSKNGNAHGVIDSTVLPAAPADYSGVFSRMRGYSNDFGTGWKASVDVYVNLSDPAVLNNTYGWDVSTAANNTSGGHRRDFIFHAASNADGKVLIAGSNNSNFKKRNDLAAINHHEITTSGWYTLEWVFRDNGGVLAVDLNLRDANGTWLWTETRSSTADVIGTVVGGSRYMWFTFVAADKLAIDNTKMSRNVSVTCSPASGSVFEVGTTPVTCTATDVCGNVSTCSFSVTVEDHENPAIEITSVTQNSQELLVAGAPTAIQGDVVITITAGDSCGLASAPTVTVTAGSEVTTLDAVGTGPAWTYTYSVTSATANGTATITATVADTSDNTGSDSATFDINKNQITGSVELESLKPAVGGITRNVTLVVSGGLTGTWTLPVTFAAGSSVGTFTIQLLPDATGPVAISAKTAWNLRRKITGLIMVDGQLTPNFTGAGMLLGGDINNSNSINVLDYSLLKTSWGIGAAGDIDGNGFTGTTDYAIMQRNWFRLGD